MSSYLWVFVWTPLISPQCVATSETAGLYGDSMFNILRSHHTAFHSSCPIFLPPAVPEGSDFLHLHQHLLLAAFFDSSLVGVMCGFVLHFPDGWWCWASLHVLMEPFLYLWRNVYSSPLPIFLAGDLSFYWVVRVLCMWVPLPYHIDDLWIICCHSVGCLFTFFMLSFEAWKFLILMKFKSLISYHLCFWCP